MNNDTTSNDFLAFLLKVHNIVIPFVRLEDKKTLALSCRAVKNIIAEYLLSPTFTVNVPRDLQHFDEFKASIIGRWIGLENEITPSDVVEAFAYRQNDVDKNTRINGLLEKSCNWSMLVQDVEWSAPSKIIVTGITQAQLEPNEFNYSYPFDRYLKHFRLCEKEFSPWNWCQIDVQKENMVTKSLELCVPYVFVSRQKTIQKIGKNVFSIFHGDGGEDDVCFPAWALENLDFEQNNEFRDALLALDAENFDLQPSGIVHDIIDPNLYTRYFPDVSVEASRQRLRDRLQIQIPFIQRYTTNMKYFKNTLKLADSYEPTIRDKFHWVPSDIHISASGKVKFLSDISGVADKNQKMMKLYFEQLFEALLPLYRTACPSVFVQGRPLDIQVVCKAQRYVLPHQVQYSGKWHTEGLTENVMLSSVYYLEQDDGLDGGSLLFFSEGAPDSCHEGYGFAEFSCKTGTAVAFPNFVPHRMRTLTNTSDLPCSRLFCNFFILNPEYKLPSTRNFQSDLDLEAAKARRAESREIMANPTRKSGITSIFYGNCGNIHYIDDATRVMYGGVEESDIVSRFGAGTGIELFGKEGPWRIQTNDFEYYVDSD
jgi:hypothetical protein